MGQFRQQESVTLLGCGTTERCTAQAGANPTSAIMKDRAASTAGGKSDTESCWTRTAPVPKSGTFSPDSGTRGPGRHFGDGCEAGTEFRLTQGASPGRSPNPEKGQEVIPEGNQA